MDATQGSSFASGARLILVLIAAVSGALASEAESAAKWQQSIQEGGRLARAGEYQAAEQVLQTALKAARQVAAQGWRVAVTMNNLGGVYEDLGQYRRAQHSYRAALRLWERLCGPDGPELAPVLNNLGSVYLATNRLKDAENQFERSLAIRRKCTGPGSPPVYVPLGNLAQIYYVRREYERAERAYLEALRDWRQTPGSDSARGGALLNNLALVYARRGSALKAVSALQESITEFKSTLGPRHPVLIKPHLNLAREWLAAGRTEEAELLLQSARALAECCLPGSHPVAAAVLAEYASLLRRTKRPGEAASLERAAKAMIRDHSRENLLDLTVDASGLARPDARDSSP